MDFSDKELKVLLQALYRFRGEVSGASQTEQNKLAFVASIIEKIEGKVGPVRAERTRFDEEMARNLSVLAFGRPGAKADLDKGGAAPKVKKASSSRSSPAGKAPGKGGGAAPRAGAKAPGRPKAGSGKTKS